VKIRGNKGFNYNTEIKEDRTRLKLSNNFKIYKSRKINRNESARFYRLRDKETTGSIRRDNYNERIAETYERIY
jgi:hypothetical protein